MPRPTNDFLSGASLAVWAVNSSIAYSAIKKAAARENGRLPERHNVQGVTLVSVTARCLKTRAGRPLGSLSCHPRCCPTKLAGSLQALSCYCCRSRPRKPLPMSSRCPRCQQRPADAEPSHPCSDSGQRSCRPRYPAGLVGSESLCPACGRKFHRLPVNQADRAARPSVQGLGQRAPMESLSCYQRCCWTEPAASRTERCQHPGRSRPRKPLPMSSRCPRCQQRPADAEPSHPCSDSGQTSCRPRYPAGLVGSESLCPACGRKFHRLPVNQADRAARPSVQGPEQERHC